MFDFGKLANLNDLMICEFHYNENLIKKQIKNLSMRSVFTNNDRNDILWHNNMS